MMARSTAILHGGRFVRLACLAALPLASAAAAAPAPPPPGAQRMEEGPAQLEGVGVDEKLGAQVPLQLAFTESTGERVTLGQLITARRPVILTLNYSSCPMLCSLQLDAFVQGLRGLAWTVGEQFDIVTVSIDPTEKLERTQQFKEKYLTQYGREAARGGWHFLTGDRETIATLARTVGFGFKLLPDTGEYAHAAALMVLSPEGMVSRYLYGVLYEPRDLRFALVEAAEGKVGSTVDRILLYCFHYDATVGRYAPAAANIMRLGGVVTIIVLAGVLGTFWLRDERRPRLPLG